MEDSLFADWWHKSRQEQQKTEIKLPGDERVRIATCISSFFPLAIDLIQNDIFSCSFECYSHHVVAFMPNFFEVMRCAHFSDLV
jgi:hypothetical protein